MQRIFGSASSVPAIAFSPYLFKIMAPLSFSLPHFGHRLMEIFDLEVTDIRQGGVPKNLRCSHQIYHSRSCLTPYPHLLIFILYPHRSQANPSNLLNFFAFAKRIVIKSIPNIRPRVPRVHSFSSKCLVSSNPFIKSL